MNQRDIAKLAGVSSATVSRVINKDPRVSAKTAQKVVEVIERFGYVQNAMARNLRMANTKTIGYLVPDIRNPFFTSLLAGFEVLMYEKDYDILFVNTNEDIEKERKAMKSLLHSRVNGILAVFVDPDNEYIEKYKNMGIYIVYIDRISKNEMNNDSILIDNYGGMKQIVDYLVSLGHKDIALTYGSPEITPGEERLNGYYLAMQKAGLQVRQEYVVPCYFTENETYKAVEQLLSLKKRPTAIITPNNLATMGAYKALTDHKIRIPKEISLIGFDDFSLAAHLNPPVTVITRPTTVIGKIAAEMLLERIESDGEITPRKIILPTELIIRKSCTKCI
jgi:LacI family transcriptional regulator